MRLAPATFTAHRMVRGPDRHKRRLAQAGELLEVIGACTKVQALPGTETQLRKLTKALNPVYVVTFGEVEDDNAVLSVDGGHPCPTGLERPDRQ